MTTDDILTALKDSAVLPPASVSITDAKLIGFMNEQMWNVVTPWVASAQGNYLLDSEDTAIVASTATYAIPKRAIAGGVVRISYIDANGNDLGELPQFSVTDLDGYQSAGDPPSGFYFKEGQIVLVPAPSSSATGSIRVFYRRRPGELVNGTNYCSVTSTTDTVLTCASVNTTTFAIGQYIDITQGVSPFRVLGKDLAITGSNATTITIGAGGLSALGIAAGDYVTIQRKSYVPQMPQEWHAVVEMATVARVQRQLGDLKGYQATMGDLMRMRKDVLDVAQPRSQTNRRVVTAWGWR